MSDLGRKSLQIILLPVFLFLLGTGGLFPVGAQILPEALQVRHYEGIPYICGGVGLDERNAINAMGKAYSLKMLFSVRGGELLADVSVKITDERGMVVFEVVADGPLLYAKLPPGKYTATVSMMNKAQTRPVQVLPNAQASLHFIWSL